MSEVTIKISGKDASDSAFRQAKNNEERLAAAAKAAGIDLTVMGQKGEVAGKITAAGAENARAGIRRLDAGIGELNKGMRVLQDEFEKTGDVDFLRQGKRLQAARKELEGFKKELVGLLTPDGSEVEKIGRKIGKDVEGGLFDTLGALPSRLKGSMIPILAGLGVGLLPAISGAVTAAVSGGVIAGGIVAAAQSTQVQSAWKDLGGRAKDAFTEAAKPFEEPLIRAANRFGDTMYRIMPGIRTDFALLTPLVDKLVDGASGFVIRLMPGVNELSRQSGTLAALADELPRIGHAFSDAFESIARGAGGGKEALIDVIHSTEGFIVVMGKLLEYSERWYASEKALAHLFTGDFSGAVDRATVALTTNAQASIAVGPAVQSAMDAVGTAIVGVGEGAAMTADQFKVLGDAVDRAGLSFDNLMAGKMVDRLLGDMMGLDQATLGFAEAQTRLSAAIDDNGRALDVHTAKGQANREAVLAVVQANIRQYDAMIASGASAASAAAAYDQNTGALIKQMKQAGFTSDQIQGLIGKYMAVPDKVNTDIEMHGLTNAISDLDHTLRLINGLHDKDVYITTHNVHLDEYGNVYGGSKYGRSAGAGYAHGGIVGAAGGGPRSNRIWVGEHGRELVDLAPGSFVHSNPDSERMAAAAAPAPAGPMRIEFRFTGDTDSALATVLNKLARTGQLTAFATT